MTDEIITESETPTRDSESKPDINLIRALPPSIRRPTFTYRLPAFSNSKKDGDTFYPAEYNFVDIGLAEDTDSFVFQANFKKLALSIKANWAFTSRNQDHLDYVRKRLSEMEIAQGQTFWALFVEILSNLIRYHNCFLIKSRNFDASSGKVRNIDGRKLNPVAGYFVASPETIQFKIGKDYNIKMYKHVMPDGREKLFPPEDVIHFHIYRKTHHLTGTPAWIPVLDDVMALRRIEEHVETLIYRHIYPLFQYKVGTEKSPMQRYEDGLTEVDVVKKKIRDMPSDGMVVTPERHEIKGLGSESRALRAETYLEYFKKRVIAGSGMSEIDFGFGDTSNRSTADTMSKLAIDNVKFYQQSMADTINYSLVRELMLESTFSYDHSDDGDKVELQFNEVDIDSQMKVQNHYMLLYQGHVTTESEARKSIGRGPLSDDHREDTFLSRVEKQKADWSAQADVDKANAVAKNRQQPTNQYGKKSGPAKKRSFVEKDGYAAEVYNELANDLNQMGNSNRQISLGYVNQLFLASSERAKAGFKDALVRAVNRGAAGFPLPPLLRVELDVLVSRMTRNFNEDVDRLFREASSKTSIQLITKDYDRLAIDTLEYRIRFIERTLQHKAYILAKAATLRKNGITRARVVCDPEGQDFDSWNNVVIDLTTILPDELPPFHVNCQCDIDPETTNG